MGMAALGYVRIKMRDPAAWRQFGEQVMGFVGETAEDGSVRLKMDAAPFRYLVEQGEQDRFAAAGWECKDAQDYGRYRDALAAAGALSREGSAEEAQRRGVAQLAFAADPSGNALELYHGRTCLRGAGPSRSLAEGSVGGSDRFVSPIPGLEFVTGAMGLGHLVLPAQQFQETAAFYRDLLDFGLSDDLRLPPAAEGLPEQRLNFFHADNPRHHSLGLYNYPAPSGVGHIMVEVNSLDNVGHCLDRVKAADLDIVATLGRHFNDRMLSFYLLAPGGIPMECGCDGRQIHDWDSFEPTSGSVPDIWGHEYNFPS